MYDRTILPAGTVLATTGQTGPCTLSSDAVSVQHVEVNVTAVSGTSPSLTVAFQRADIGTDYPPSNWTTVATSDPITAAGATTITTPAIPSGAVSNFYRLSYAITGTSPSFTLGATTDA
jgi:hypothetical protein